MRLPPPLDSLAEANQKIVCDHLTPAWFAAGTCIFRKGAAPDGCYLIESGDVRLEADADAHVDTERVLGYLRSGSLLGELALLDGLPRSASAFAETEVRAQHLSTSALAKLRAEWPQIGIGLLEALGRVASVKLREMTERFAEVNFPEAADPEVNRDVAKAAEAQRAFARWPEERVDVLLAALANAVAGHAEPLARATVEETGIGNITDKTSKNIYASLGVYRSLAGKVGQGIVATDPDNLLTEIASPAGVVFALVPVTNPVATAVFKTLISLKSRCALILSFHHACLGVGNMVCALMQSVLDQNGAPPNLLQWVRERSSRRKTAQFMGHNDVSLILATGGAAMVEAAYSSGTPALGVGPGNCPTYVAADADIDAAARAIVESKPYDNGLICGAEHNLVVDLNVRAAFVEALDRHGAAVLAEAEANRLMSRAVTPDGRHFDRRIVGQTAQVIAAAVGIKREYVVKLIVIPAPSDAIERQSALAGEKLAPVLSLFTVQSENEALDLCRRLLAFQGAGHTASIHTRSPDRAERFALHLPASRILVNSPAVQGVCGMTTKLAPSFTLGCGTFGGNSTTDNVSYRNLQNIKRLAFAAGA
ncbi:MAG TPA: aldehyde dehydrogenase family protein, partial [Xanthobacteraceae bacterium]|nr:aldehyde dehydrogenase family protein [Xanthobacteraceae bacterium]